MYSFEGNLLTQRHQISSYETRDSGLSYGEQESPANAKGTRDSSACMKAHCEQMKNT